MIVPQFASHNAGTIAAIVQMAGARSARFEMQRLHGMGEGVYREVLAALPELALRVYAPVGEHRDLLAYLVRRLLENGANSSFVHQLANAAVPVDELLRSPLHAVPGAGHAAADRPLRPGRAATPSGVDLAVRGAARAAAGRLGQGRGARGARDGCRRQVDATMQRLHRGWPAWNAMPVSERAALLERAADRLEARLPHLCGLAGA